MDATARVEIRRINDFSTIEPLWRDLESRADGSFFQSWAWTGCLAEERFCEPWLLSAWDGNGRPIALGLFNRRRRRGLRRARPFLLAESGEVEIDSTFIEHNGLLIERAAPDGLARSCWAAMAAEFRHASWILSGVPARICDDFPARHVSRVRAQRPAPYADFAKIGSADTPFLDQLSANLRQQMRRSLRAWEAVGPLRLEIAVTTDQADVFMDALKALHQRYWMSRGKPGAFAEPFFERFHRALLRRAGLDQSVDLMRITAGDRIVGYLHNLVHQGTVAAYQSGFDFSADADQKRPGLVCHLLAIEHYRRAGMRLYDFLGGEARYKRGFSNAETELLWLEVRPKLIPFFGFSSTQTA